MKKLLLLAMALCVGSASAAELKIGVVDWLRVQQQSPVAQKISKKIEDEFSKRNQDVEKLKQRAVDLQADLEKNEATLSDAEKRKRDAEVRDLNLKFQRAQRELREDYNARMSTEMVALQERAIKAAKQLAEAEKYDLIMPGDGLSFFSTRIDVTDKILKLMDK